MSACFSWLGYLASLCACSVDADKYHLDVVAVPLFILFKKMLYGSDRSPKISFGLLRR